MANTSADKLRAALDSKADIASAIDEMGGTFATDADKSKLAKFGDAIRSIPTGGADLVESLDAPTPENIKDGFLRIVKAPLKDKDGTAVTDSSGNTLYGYSLYIWKTDSFVAAHGAYDAKDVYFSDNLLSTYAIGNYSLTDGQVTIPAKGKNLEELFTAIYQKEDSANLRKTYPSVTSNASITWYEVGSAETTKDVTATFHDGVYKYGPTPGCTATKYYFGSEGQNTGTKTISSGAFDARKKVTISIKADYSDATANPKSNTGVEYSAQKFLSSTTNPITPELFGCYVPLYWGFKKDDTVIDDPANITADEIKALPAAGGWGAKITNADAYNGKFLTSMTAPASFRQLFYAVPTDFSKQLSEIVDKNGLPLTVKHTDEIGVTFGTGTAAVTKNYKVYYVSLPALYDTLELTLTWIG